MACSRLETALSDNREASFARTDRQDDEPSTFGYQQYLDKLTANAARCRELADAASDPDVRQALLDMANDIDAAVPILEQDARR